MSAKLSHHIIKALNHSCTEATLVKEFYSRKGFWPTLERVSQKCLIEGSLQTFTRTSTLPQTPSFSIQDLGIAGGEYACLDRLSIVIHICNKQPFYGAYFCLFSPEWEEISFFMTVNYILTQTFMISFFDTQILKLF